MFELDKQKFGAFVAALRKEKGLTQKELAQQLFLSDKAVSKWERGLSMPDITLLVPLADALGVTVTELLECRRMERPRPLDAGEVEALVKKALSLSEPDGEALKKRRRQRGLVLGACVLASALELGGLCALGYTAEQISLNLLVYAVLGLVFGIYSFFFMKDRLPAYYDENKISVYGDGMFRMNMPGVYFNNSNWPYIGRVVRVWCMAALCGFPLVYWAVSWFFPELWEQGGRYVMLVMTLGGLFLPVWFVAKKYG